LAELKHRIKEAHGSSLKYIVWAGMGGSAEDKAMYQAVGLLKKGPKLFLLDSTDPAKLKFILQSLEKKGSLAEALKSTLVVGMAMGMTSYEPVVNLQMISALYEKLGIDSRPNIIYMTLPNSLLDQFGRKQGYRKVELQLDNGNSTAGRHSGPLTRGSLYPLGLAGVDLESWIDATLLGDEQIDLALRLASFLHQQASEKRDKVTLLLPKAWAGAGVWTKQNFEESLGKSADFGLKIVIGERIKLANYRSPRDPQQDRCFVAVQAKGLVSGESAKVAALRRAGYPVSVITFKDDSLSQYMQFMHYVVFGVGYLQKMNFVTQPSVELYKAVTSNIFNQACERGSIEQSDAWQALMAGKRYRHKSGVTLHCHNLPAELLPPDGDAASAYAHILKTLVHSGQIGYGELTFFGDTRYNPRGKAIRKVLDRAGDRVFRAAMKMPVDVYEGPAMNHSYHEMIIGHGHCFSTVLLSEKSEKLSQLNYPPDYHRAQFLATQIALAQRRRHVVALVLKDLEESTQDALDSFFHEVAGKLRTRNVR
ncbi:MAG TPA: hypothetical protein VE621_24115, partial [Bryobacteraceae bacterium]|nr:hypothetical protein [Bryobacteraceae bacterium]